VKINARRAFHHFSTDKKNVVTFPNKK